MSGIKRIVAAANKGMKQPTAEQIKAASMKNQAVKLSAKKA